MYTNTPKQCSVCWNLVLDTEIAWEQHERWHERLREVIANASTPFFVSRRLENI